MIDTIQISHDLQKSGLPPEQAEAIAQAMLSIPAVSGLATKEDITALREDFIKLRSEFASLKLMVAGVYALLVPILLKLFLH